MFVTQVTLFCDSCGKKKTVDKANIVPEEWSTITMKNHNYVVCGECAKKFYVKLAQLERLFTKFYLAKNIKHSETPNDKIPRNIEGCIKHSKWDLNWEVEDVGDNVWHVLDDEEKIVSTGRTELEACQNAIKEF